ncbi:hypothetical protein PUN28_006386 [Cardiocondyla obscurior]|uniref:Ribosomal protein L2 n=1 Tax=Cardiocondyla obscurior TaxID=286306 RepID=A0AAW2GC90_9HYME
MILRTHAQLCTHATAMSAISMRAKTGAAQNGLAGKRRGSFRGINLYNVIK